MENWALGFATATLLVFTSLARGPRVTSLCANYPIGSKKSVRTSRFHPPSETASRNAQSGSSGARVMVMKAIRYIKVKKTVL